MILCYPLLSLLIGLRFILQKSVLLSRAYALEINILLSRVWDLLGAPKVHPMGVAPELRVDY
jgi:hypothetical protein